MIHGPKDHTQDTQTEKSNTRYTWTERSYTTKMSNTYTWAEGSNIKYMDNVMEKEITRYLPAKRSQGTCYYMILGVGVCLANS